MQDSARVWLRGILVPEGEADVLWDKDGTVSVRDIAFENHGPYRVTVIVEPAGGWRQRTWADVRENDRVSLGGVEAVVLSAHIQRWHVDPRSDKYNPRPLEHDIVMVRLQVVGQEPRVYSMPPSGPIMILEGQNPIGPAVAAIAREFGAIEVIKEEG